MEFARDDKMRDVSHLSDQLFRHVLYDEEPSFVSDEATIFDVSLAAPEELLKRLSSFYQTDVSRDELAKPLWQLLLDLESRRLDPESHNQ